MKYIQRLFAVLLLALATIPPAVQAQTPQKPKPAAEAKQPGFRETWQSVYIGNSRVGYGRSSLETKVENGETRIVTDTEMVMALSRFGQTVKTRTVLSSEETPNGDLLKFRFDLENPPAAPTRTAGYIADGKLIIEKDVAGKTTRTEMPWDATIKAPGYQDRLLRENPLKPGEKRTLKAFDPQFNQVATITLQAGDYENVELLNGQKQKLLKVSVKQSLLPVLTIDEWLDAEGDAAKTSMGLLQLVIYKVSRDEALKSLTGEEVDLAIGTLVKVEPIPNPFGTTRVVYRVKIPGEDAKQTFSTGPTQSVTAVERGIVDVAVTSLRPGGAVRKGAAPGAEYTAPNAYIQSDDAEVQKHAEAAAGGETDPWKIATRMEKWVYENLKKKNFSTLLASAAEVARDLSGDCTEHAVLLAAMARAKGIPSRVAVGLVYVDSLSSFGGHMWTEVNIDGVWYPLDATLAQGGIAADHLKFADSSFAAKNGASPLATFLPLVTVLGKIEISVKEVKH
jgi:hypothetical protein